MRGKVQAANKRAEEEKERRRTDLHWNAKFPLLKVLKRGKVP
jgi:hypothetical protein